MSTNSTYTREGGKNTLLLSRYFFRRRRGSDGYCYYGSLVETHGQRETVRDVTETEAGVIVCVLKNEDEIRNNPLCTLLLKTPTYHRRPTVRKSPLYFRTEDEVWRRYRRTTKYVIKSNLPTTSPTSSASSPKPP